VKSTAPDSRAAEVDRTAAAVILEKGSDATSVSDIADAPGLTKAGLYHYIQDLAEFKRPAQLEARLSPRAPSEKCCAESCERSSNE